jgi:hypothetical protein
VVRRTLVLGNPTIGRTVVTQGVRIRHSTVVGAFICGGLVTSIRTGAGITRFEYKFKPQIKSVKMIDFRNFQKEIST